MRLQYAIIFVSDMRRSIEFYRDVLGMPVKFETPGWSELATEGATIALHAAEPARGVAASEHPAAGGCRPGLRVPDLDAFHRRMVEKKVRCTQEPRDVFGSRVAQYLDPDGLAISVGEERRNA